MMMMGRLVAVVCGVLVPMAAFAEPAATVSTVAVDDCEADPGLWRYVGGEEFPGARGSLARDTTKPHGGAACEKLAADFSGGGAYVGVWRDMPDLDGRYLIEVRLWVRTSDVRTIGIRLGDSSGQCHQTNSVQLTADGSWHELVLPVRDLVGGEHWGGANDGKWHGPAKGLGVNIGKDSMNGATQGTLWFDDLACAVSSAPPAEPTVLPCRVAPASCRPGFGTNVTYRWDAEPMGRDFTVFVHVLGPDGAMVTQGDHEPPTTTAVWSGRVEYDQTIILPTSAPEGRYRIVVGLYDHGTAARGWDRQALKHGEGVTVGEDGTSFEVGSFTVDARAPLPELGPPTLDLSGYHVTFSEDFDAPLDVSAWGPGTRWIAHTPYAGDFGDARFADPEPGFPFVVEDGNLRIEVRKDEKGWRAGLLSSVDPNGVGFSQQYGYFEMRAKLPKGEGTWPAFWLLGVPGIKDKSRANIEIDVVEEYGVNTNALHTTVHVWGPGEKHWADGRPFLVTGMTDDFHTYGVMVTPEDIVFYFDRVELRRLKTPEAGKAPLYLLVNLALGGGWPIDKTPNPSFMYVDYVRAYAK